MKAITPVIALVMLMLITVGIVGAASVWFSGLFSSSTSKAISIPPGGALCSNGEIKVFVLNNGDKTLTGSDILIAQIDGNDVSNSPFFGDMSSGLVGYWKFDEGSGAVAKDYSVSANDASLKPLCPDCPAWAMGKSGNALDFDGSNDYLSASQVSPAKITVMSWVNFDTLSGYQEIVAQKGTPAEGAYFLRKDSPVEGNKISFFVYDGAVVEPRVYSATIPVTGTWYHLTALYDGAYIKLYINGKLEGTVARPAINYGPGGSLIIGSSGNLVNRMGGLLDEIKVYNKNVGDINVQPGKSGMIINYPGATGKHTIKIATSSSTAETAVICA